MKKRMAALILVFSVSIETAGSVQAQTMDRGLAYETEESYVIMGEDIEKVEEIIGTEILEEDSIETGEGEIVTLELSNEEAEALEKLDIVIEEDILFSASALNIEGTKDVPETEQASESGIMETAEVQDNAEETAEPENVPSDMQDAEPGPGETGITDTEAEENLKEPGNTEGTEPAEELENTEESENMQETESTEKPEDTEEEDTEEEEETEEDSGQGREKADARDDWNIAAVHGESYTGDKAPGDLLGNRKRYGYHKYELWDTPFLRDIGKSSGRRQGGRDSSGCRSRERPGGAVEYPAAYQGVCAVGSSNLEGEIASESTRGKEVDIYAPGEKKDAGEGKAQEKPLLEFDEGEIRALWKGKDHKKMVPTDINADRYKTMYAAVSLPDDDYINGQYNLLKMDRRFHGSKNYMTTLEFLINLAHEYYIKEKGNPEAVYAWAYNNPQIKKNGKDGNIVDNIKWFLRQRIRPDLKAADENTRRNKAYKIMGVVIHVAGDIYAHREKVTPDMLKDARNTGNRSEGYFVKSDFISWKTFESDVKAGDVEFREIAGDYQKNKDESSYYEDNVKIQSWRYSDAKKVVNDLVGNNAKYDFRDHRFNAGIMQHKRRLSSETI